jgi:excisionase family DNA binding protein
MTTSLNQNIKQTITTDRDAAVAKIASQILASYLQKNSADATFRLISSGTEGEIVTIPIAVLSLLVEILIQMADGNTVSIIPLKKELTTQEAADILQVSRPYLVQLLESGEIPYRKVGTRRRILNQDVINYKNRIDTARMQTLAELSAQAQELNMGY